MHDAETTLSANRFRSNKANRAQKLKVFPHLLIPVPSLDNRALCEYDAMKMDFLSLEPLVRRRELSNTLLDHAKPMCPSPGTREAFPDRSELV